MNHPTFFTHRLALASSQLAEFQAILAAPLPRLAREALAHRQAKLAADLVHLSQLVDMPCIPAAEHAGREVAA